MNIDTEHLHYWMQAIRQSPDPLRTMDAFWQGQLKSKEWLITKLRPHIKKVITVDIHGGWVGTLASMLFQSTIICESIRSIDIDPTCEPIANMMNKREEMWGKFSITQEKYDLWISGIPQSSLLVLQSNNYDIPEHVRTAVDLENFKEQCGINVLWSGELELPLYTRFMIIGQTNIEVNNV